MKYLQSFPLFSSLKDSELIRLEFAEYAFLMFLVLQMGFSFFKIKCGVIKTIIFYKSFPFHFTFRE